jgi:hypothetical protein
MYALEIPNLVGRVYKKRLGATVRKQRQHLLVLGLFAGGLAAAALVPMAVAHADDCSLGDCTLVSGGDPTGVSYEGFRPFATEWDSTQPVNVEVTDGTSFVSGSYSVTEQDFASPTLDQDMYQYSTFVPAADNPTGIDSDGLSGATVNDIAYGPGEGLTSSGDPTFLANNLDVQYANGSQIEVTTDTGEFTNVFDGTSTESGDWLVMPGDATPIVLWDSLPTPSMPDISDIFSVLPPDAWGPDWTSAFPPGLI